MGLFNFGNKKEEDKNLKITSKEESMKMFEDYAKALMASDNKGGFFMLVLNNGFSGKAAMGTPEHFEDMFGQIFHEYPELKDLLKEIIHRFENGQAKYRKDGIRQPISKDITKLAEKFVGEGNVNNPSGKIETPGNTEDPIASLLKKLVSENNKDNSQISTPEDKMREAYEKHQKKLKKEGLSDFNIDDIKKRNKEE